jgi:hypothetical protein
MQWAQPVGPVQELLRLQGLCWSQAMFRAKVPDGVIFGAIHRLRVRWLAKGGWLVRGPFHLRVLVQAVEGGALR